MSVYLPYFLIIIGICLISGLAKQAMRAHRSKRWPKVYGVLLHKGTKQQTSRSIDSDVVRWKSLHLDLEYEYQVAGTTYRSNRVTFSDGVNKPVAALDSLLKIYAVEDAIPLYYNPKNPADSVLFPGASLWNFTPMLSGILFLAGGVFFLFQTA